MLIIVQIHDDLTLVILSYILLIKLIPIEFFFPFTSHSVAFTGFSRATTEQSCTSFAAVWREPPPSSPSHSHRAELSLPAAATLRPFMSSGWCNFFGRVMNWCNFWERELYENIIFKVGRGPRNWGTSTCRKSPTGEMVKISWYKDRSITHWFGCIIYNIDNKCITNSSLQTRWSKLVNKSSSIHSGWFGYINTKINIDADTNINIHIRTRAGLVTSIFNQYQYRYQHKY